MSLRSLARSWSERLLYTTDTRSDEVSRVRAVANNLILHLHPARVPARALRFTYTWGLGGISATLALMLALTGVLLIFRYEPTVDRAYLSIQILESRIAFGSLIRAIHHWSANLLVITAFLHLVRVFLTGGFKAGRAVNWAAGVGLLLLVLVFNYTGYLLPWDQLSFWAITVSTSLLSYIPLVGPQISQFILAGPEVGQGALTNFYALHVAVLPLLMSLLLAYHFWKVRKDGGISQPIQEDGPVERVTTIPHLVRVEFLAAVLVIAGVSLFAMLVPAPLEELANPLRSPNPAKAAWYFMGVQELLLHMDTRAAMTLAVLVFAGLIVFPSWDRKHGDIGVYFRSPAGRRAAVAGVLLALDLTPLLIVADEYWVDLPGALPGLPTFIASGLIPLLLTLAGLVAIYAVIRRLFRANRSEGLVGLFAFVMTSLIVLTVIGIFFRGPNMALVAPF